MLAVLCTLLLCSALLNIYFMRPGADTRGQQQQTKRFSFRGESATNDHLYFFISGDISEYLIIIMEALALSLRRGALRSSGQNIVCLAKEVMNDRRTKVKSSKA